MSPRKRVAQEDMKKCYFCQNYDNVFDGVKGKNRCSKRRTLEFCEDYAIRPIWESRLGPDGFLLPREQWPDVAK